jgi:Beta-propeller repeat
VYPGVDLIYYGNQRQLEYDFIITPGADPRRILLDFAGATKVNLDGDSSFVIHTSAGDLRWRKPVAYQEINGGRRFVACAYARRDEHGLEFKLGAYDRTKPLIIDPVLEYSTYLGGSDSQANEFGASSSSNGIAVDGKGNTYITGWTTCVDFPIKNAFQDVAPGSSFIPNAFIAKFDTNGNLVYSTYLGGNVSLFDFPSGDFGNGIAVDAQGNAYVAGETFSLDFLRKTPFRIR